MTRPAMPIRVSLAAAACCGLLVFVDTIHAEPFLAVQQGLKCQTCHTSPTGGGKRTPYGNAFARQILAAHALGKPGGKLWTGELTRYLGVGGDLRGSFRRTGVPGQGKTSESGLDEFLGYVEFRPIPNNLTVYVDARLRPGDPILREGYVRLSTSDDRFWVRAGDFFLPFGFRLQDDDAFIRQITGINYNTPDTGVELGIEHGKWSAQLAVTRGTAGGPEVDSGKQYSFRVSRVDASWRLGGSLNFNDAAAGDRQIQNVFAGLLTGRVSWLAEIDYIIDHGTPTGRRELLTSFIEANFAPRRGHNLKITFEFLDPDVDVAEDEQNRVSLAWEYFPFQFLQTRAGYRRYNGIPQNPAQNRDELFLELHVPF